MRLERYAMLCGFTFFLLSTVAGADECEAIVLKEPSSPKAQQLAAKLSAKTLCGTNPVVSPASLQSVWREFLSSASVGGERFETPPPIGTPYGTVLPTSSGILVDFSALGDEELQNFVLESNGVRLMTLIKTPKKFLIPISLLNTRDNFAWNLTTATKSYQATFNLIDNDSAHDVSDKIKAIHGEYADFSVEMLYEAAVFEDYMLYSDRDKALAELHNTIGE